MYLLYLISNFILGDCKKNLKRGSYIYVKGAYLKHNAFLHENELRFSNHGKQLIYISDQPFDPRNVDLSSSSNLRHSKRPKLSKCVSELTDFN